MRLTTKLILYFLLSIQTLESLKSKDFCNLVSKQNATKCQSPYSHSCAVHNKCATTELNCKDYASIERYFNSAWLKRSLSAAISSKILLSALKVYKYRHEMFKLLINECSSLPYVWHENDVCIKRKYCLQEQSIANILNGVCDCTNEFGVRCGMHYCASSEEACIVFRTRSSQPALFKK